VFMLHPSIGAIRQRRAASYQFTDLLYAQPVPTWETH